MVLVPNSSTRRSNPYLPTTLARLLDSLKLFPYDSAIKYQDMASTGRKERSQPRAAIKVGMPSLGTSVESSGHVVVEAKKQADQVSTPL